MAPTKPTLRLVIGLVVVLVGLTAIAQERSEPIKVPSNPLKMTLAKRPSAQSTLEAPPPTIAPEIDPTKVETVIERYPNGSVKVERQVVQNNQADYVNHGTYTSYDPDGNVLKKGEFQNGKQHGRWVQHFAEDEGHLISGQQRAEFVGPFVSEAAFMDGKLEGIWSIQDRDGKNITEWSYDNGVRNGKCTWFHSNGQIWLEATYRDGAIDGELLEWNRDGKLVAQSTFIGGRYLAKEVGWYALGHKHFEGSYLRASNVPEPAYDWWTGTATAAPATQTVEDQKHGVWSSWYRNGNKQVQGKFDHGVPIDKFTWWYENGQKQATGEYQGGKQCATWITWHPNGLKESQVTYIDGKRFGTYMEWAADGKLAKMRDYDEAGRSHDVSMDGTKTGQRTSSATRSRHSSKR